MSACLSFLMYAVLAANPVDGNRLAYLDGHDIYYPHTKFPKLITPQWVGEDGVEAVVILAIDDMRDTAKYETYLRPILQRLKQIDGRAPLSIMTCNVKPDDPQLQTWLQEGLSLEVHTFDHPCPLLQGDLAKAKATYDKCVDLMFSIPNNTPVAYRMPCCDSLNTVSPRFYKEIFSKTTDSKRFLQVSSSVFQVYTAEDPDIPRELLFDADGKERFRKYFPKGLKRGETTHDRFLNYVENYPYPYVIDRLCWEFPCMTPSDWEANFLHQPNNPQTVADMKAALDITVLKQGVLNLVFHPHGWIQAEQINDLIDHAVTQHGKKVKFLTFKEAMERLNKNLLLTASLRTPSKGTETGFCLLDFNNDGYIDVELNKFPLRVWDASEKKWRDAALWDTTIKNAKNFPPTIRGGIPVLRTDVHGVVRAAGDSSVFSDRLMRHFISTNGFGSYFNGEFEPEFSPQSDKPQWPWRVMRDIDGDGRCELLVGRAHHKITDTSVEGGASYAVFGWSSEKLHWKPLPFELPHQRYVQVKMIDFDNYSWNCFAFVDINEDGRLDFIFSSPGAYGVWLFESFEKGWSIELMSGKRGDKPADQELPPIVRADGTDNGFFVRDRGLHWINEDTAHLPNLAVSWDFDKLLGSRKP